MGMYNPIAAIAKISKEGTVGEYVEVACPSTYQWAEEDISESDAGRNEDGTMDKQMIGQIVKLEMAWNNVTTTIASSVLQAFDSEYLMVKYLNAKSGTYEESEFYVGNRTSPLYNCRLGLWNKISFNLIERACRNET